MKKYSLWLIGAVMLALPLLVAAQDAKPKRGGKLTFGIERDISTMNPFVRISSTDRYVRGLFYEALIDEDIKGAPVPALAESWNISKDGLTYTFKIRRGVKFHNGAEMTAEDVKWCIDYVLDPKNGSEGYSYLREVKAVAMLDRYTIEFTLKEPNAAFLSYLSLRAFPVVPKGSVLAGMDRVDTFAPGTGPFVFKEWKKLSQVTFARNKDYWQKDVPFLDEVTIKVAEDPTVRFTALRAGDLDMIERTPYAFVKKAESGSIPGVKSTPAPFGGFRRIIFNVVEPPFNNPKLRQAVAYAIDRKQFIQGAFWGYGNPTEQRFPDGSSWYFKLPNRERNPSKVKALLKEAGVGPDFEIELLGRRGVEDEQQVLQQQLSTAGIKIKLISLEGATYREQQRAGSFQMILYGGDTPTDPSDVYPQEFGCDEKAIQAKKRTANVSGYCNKELDRVVLEASKMTDQKKRHEIYFSKVARVLHDELPEIPLVYVPRFFTYNDKVKGFTTDGDGRFNGVSFGLSKVWVDR
jgi:peptide/nickel transport system substrate-binding protein